MTMLPNTLYDLIEAPWIPVVGLDGSLHEIGLRETLVRAHEWREVRDPIPLVEFGLYRLLAALALDIYQIGKGQFNRWGDMVEKGRWEAQAIDAYFTRYADRFRLFDTKHPFLQTPGMEQEPAKPIAALLPAIPSGTNAAHFHHAHEDEFGVSPAVAARLLTTMAPFMTAGGAGLAPSINGAPPWYVLTTGSNLFQTVCLNAFAQDLPQAQGSAPPAWRNDAPIQDDRRADASLLEALTWRPRRIQLISGQGGVCTLTGRPADILVRSMRFRAGESVDFSWRDPNVSYRLSEDKGWLPMRPRPGREIWRDSGPLAFLKEGQGEEFRFDRPRVIDQLDKAVKDNILPKSTNLQLTAYGMRTDMKMKVFEWLREPLSVPFELVINSKLQSEAQSALRLADEAAGALKMAIRKCYPAGGDNSGALQPLCDYAERRFWSDLHDRYDAYLLAIAASSEAGAEAAGQWQRDVKRLAWDAFAGATDDLDSSASAIKRLVQARDYFAKRLGTIFTAGGERPKDKRKIRQTSTDEKETPQ